MLRLVMPKRRDNLKLLYAIERCVSGIMQAIRHFNLWFRIKAHESRSVVEPATTGSNDSTAARSIEKEADVFTSASQALQNAQPAPITDEHYKRSNDALAAARERALARKRAKEHQI
ncbi:uncharacterized protein LOC123439760 [Hordeum vulgare subsp. vulgare]|uniref:uncharacterized protein LOC123439760 n=1 Tax=Hordeum vulgare subsp. vulgare TaxID=112509 RepID=UPI001D1A3F66|nr:uncharacterized protein LOC123439760 [Hordeum vulgare subsp. vulgare]